MEDRIVDIVHNVRDMFRKEISYQALNYELSADEITYNIELCLTLLNEIDELSYDTMIEVTYNPMGLYQYRIIENGDDENE